MPHEPSRTRYTLEQREAAIALAEKVGQARAVRELGISKSTMSTWCNQPKKPV